MAYAKEQANRTQLAFVTRTRGGERLTSFLACLYAIQLPKADVYLIGISTDHVDLTPHQLEMIIACETNGYHFHFQVEWPTGIGSALAEGIILARPYPYSYVIFIDDDVIFSREDIDALIMRAQEAGSATWIPRDSDTEATKTLERRYKDLGFIDPYFSCVTREALKSFEPEDLEVLTELGYVDEAAFFSAILRTAVRPFAMWGWKRPWHVYTPRDHEIEIGDFADRVEEIHNMKREELRQLNERKREGLTNE